MAVAIEQTTQATTLSATSLLLPSWSVVAGEFLAVGVALRDDTVVPTVSGHGLTWVAEQSVIGAQGQNACYLFRAQAAVNATGQITISLPANSDPVGAVGVRFSGQIQGNNGADGIDADVGDPGPLVDDNDMLTPITTIADNCLVTAWGTHRLAAFTPPAGQTTLQTVNVGSSGDTTNSSLWRLNGLKTPAGLVTMGGLNDLDSVRDWCMWALSLKPAVAPPVVSAGGSPSSLLTIIGL
jgi:hypothetical protein